MNIANIVKYGLMGLALIAAFAGGTYVSHLWRDNSEEAQAARAVQAQMRPAFALPDLQGNMRDVREWEGKVIVVNFWATWCPPCRREMPGFTELQQRYAAQGLQFVGIALDEETPVRDFVDTSDVPYPILLGGDAAMSVSHAYGNRFDALPYTAVVDRNGNVVSTFRGEVDIAETEKLIQRLL